MLKWLKMNGVLGHDSAYKIIIGRCQSACAYEMKFGMDHAPGAVSIAPPVDPQSGTLPLRFV